MKDFEYMNVMLPKEQKKQIRRIAAEMETSLSQAAQKLVAIGVEAYLSKESPAYTDPNPRPVMEEAVNAQV
jgi:hypothetical protein